MSYIQALGLLLGIAALLALLFAVWQYLQGSPHRDAAPCTDGRRLHRWTRWELSDKHEQRKFAGVEYFSVLQTRHCTDCGYLQYYRDSYEP